MHKCPVNNAGWSITSPMCGHNNVVTVRNGGGRTLIHELGHALLGMQHSFEMEDKYFGNGKHHHGVTGGFMDYDFATIKHFFRNHRPYYTREFNTQTNNNATHLSRYNPTSRREEGCAALSRAATNRNCGSKFHLASQYQPGDNTTTILK
mmetsp:Transcript_2199/g.3238  ORF Transcript_2199/g.3238 Transcript_2199/m.3238 type:complete len:150 (+) Transcript_2199:314-763(+)